MTPLQHLRLAVALAHAVPDARLHLARSDDDIVVGRHPAATTDACTMRRVVATALARGEHDHAERITSIELAGSLQHVGGGVFCHVGSAGEQRWMATLLAPAATAALLERIGDDPARGDALTARVCPDPALGVTLVAIGSAGGGHLDELDDVAAEAAAVIYAEELRVAAVSGALGGPVLWEVP